MDTVVEGKEGEAPVKLWKTCCSNTDPRFLKYIVQVIMGFLLVGTAIVGLMTNDRNREVWFSLLFGTAGVFWPHPQVKPPTYPPPTAILDDDIAV